MSNGASDATWTAINNAYYDGDSAFIVDACNALEGIAAVISVVQPYAAAAVAIIGLAQALIQLNQPNPTQTALENLATELQQLFDQLEASDFATALLSRNSRVLNDYMNGALTALGELNASYNDPAQYPPGPLIEGCVQSLNNFLSNDTDAWNTNYPLQEFQKVYWTDVGLFNNVCNYGNNFSASNDAGYGPQPPSNDGVTVFEYRLTLPEYLYAVSIFLAVGGSLDPNFIVNQSTPLGWALSTLQTKHRQILSGLETLSPPDWTIAGLVQTVCFNPNKSGPPGIRLIYDSSNSNVVIGAMMEYGAVERFSGVSSMSTTYQINLSGTASDSNPALFNKLQLRLLKHTQDVFLAVGLGRVWETINRLSALLGQPVMPKPTFNWPDGSAVDLTDWSFRQIFHVAKLAPTGNVHSLRALGALIIGTQPFDTPYSPGATTFSFRQLLTNFPD
jgi:hypothetical protein